MAAVPYACTADSGGLCGRTMAERHASEAKCVYMRREKAGDNIAGGQRERACDVARQLEGKKRASF